MGTSPLFCAVLAAVVSAACAKIGGWDSAPNTQYHIQTDEGPERYFKYQTLSGQYRKEKRLQDGTVVGTYGWVGPDGYLRLRDYIADGQGYRIVRTKKVLVGVGAPVSSAVSAAKHVPSQGGVGVQHAKINAELSSNAIDNYPSSTPAPISLSDFLKQSKETSTAGPYSGPEVYITPSNHFPSSTSPPEPYYPSSTPAPYYPSSTASSYYPSSTPKPYYPSSTAAPYYDSSAATASATPSYVRPVTFRPHLDPDTRRVYDAVGADRYSSPREPFPLYDGVSLTHNGFRYYLPRHYHEEETLSSEQRAGSFGYIDPFGIRRVIYYNTSPGSGFVHRKNNRYVGFDSTPYDPRY